MSRSLKSSADPQPSIPPKNKSAWARGPPPAVANERSHIIASDSIGVPVVFGSIGVSHRLPGGDVPVAGRIIDPRQFPSLPTFSPVYRGIHPDSELAPSPLPSKRKLDIHKMFQRTSPSPSTWSSSLIGVDHTNIPGMSFLQPSTLHAGSGSSFASSSMAEPAQEPGTPEGLSFSAAIPGNSTQLNMTSVPSAATAAVLVQSAPVPKDAIPVQGPNFERPLGLQELLSSYERIGFQATSLGRAIEIVEKMRKWRLSDEPIAVDESEDFLDPEVRANTKCTIMLGYTSNLISSGLREVILHLVKHKQVSAIVTTAGGIEEDFIKCLRKTYLGDFQLDGAELRKKGMNRIGNLVVPNDNYCAFEDWITPILDEMLQEQKDSGEPWSPSKMIRRLGKEINHEESVYYWAYKNDIPVFCPALTDGSLGDMIFFHSYRSPGLVIDIVSDIRAINSMALKAKKGGMIILGGGVCKHQIANAMLMRNGADYSVFINTGQEFDGSDSGARPDEAISWGKIRPGAEAVKVFADATLVFPLLVAATFAKAHWEETEKNETLDVLTIKPGNSIL